MSGACECRLRLYRADLGSLLGVIAVVDDDVGDALRIDVESM
jgi:hypothetical protein